MAVLDSVAATLVPLEPPDALLEWAGPEEASLDFDVQSQSQEFWCWVAVAASVAAYYDTNNPDSNGAWRQCEIAKSALDCATDCCSEPSSPECNKPGFLHASLRVTRNLDGGTIDRPLSFSDELTPEIGERKRPVCCHVGWNGGGAHAVVVFGYYERTIGGQQVPWVEVGDPWPDSITGQYVTLSYSDFLTRYKGSGSWQMSYLTKGEEA